MPSIDERVTTIEQRLDQMAVDQHEINGDVAKVSSALLLAMRVMTRGVNAQIASMERKFDEKFARVDDRLGRIDERFAVVDDKLDAMSADASAILQILGSQRRPGGRSHENRRRPE